MDKIIVYLDDAAHAQHQLAPMKSSEGAQPVATHWILVACPPRMTRRIGKWVSHSARESWRARWAEKLLGQVVPALLSRGDSATAVVASGPLAALTKSLCATHGACRVLDARRPRFGVDLPPVTADQPAPGGGRWEVPGAVAGLGAMLLLAAD
ncbi:MAG: hypothetical protein HYX47_06650 [Burkholderiales bacterium]|nr:hypothetical protein [Burkholderiales bacterium]